MLTCAPRGTAGVRRVCGPSRLAAHRPRRVQSGSALAPAPGPLFRRVSDTQTPSAFRTPSWDPPKRCFRWRLACAAGKLFPVSFAETSRGGGRTARRPALLAQRSGFKAPPCLREPGQACRRSGPSFASAVRRLLPDAGDRWVGLLETVTCWLSRGRKCSDPPSKHPGVPPPAHAASLCLALRELAKPSSRTAAPVRVPRAALRAPPWPRGRTPRCPSARHPRRQAVRAAPAASFR